MARKLPPKAELVEADPLHGLNPEIATREIRAAAIRQGRDEEFEASTRSVVEGAYALRSELDPGVTLRTAETRAVSRTSSKAVVDKIAKIARFDSAKALRQLRAEIAEFAKRLPTPARWEEFYRTKVIPVVNGLSVRRDRCAECGKLFLRREGKQYCSDGCRARVHNRGRDKTNGGKSAAENAARRREQSIRRHFEKCAVCKAGWSCSTLEAFHQADDAMSHVTNALSPEEAESLHARGGRTPKRTSDRRRRLTR